MYLRGIDWNVPEENDLQYTYERPIAMYPNVYAF